MIVTDLDGTLFNSDSRINDDCRRALEAIGADNRLRVIATGRNLYSAKTVIDKSFPIDYLVFSSGAGIIDWHTHELVATHSMPTPLADRIAAFIDALGLPYMIHAPVPDNHHFVYRRGRIHVSDFDRRLERYRSFAIPLPTGAPEIPWAVVSQLLVMENSNTATCLKSIANAFPEANVIGATSPLDHTSAWVEIFNQSVSKSFAAEWLRQRHDIDSRDTAGVGNDYNDFDLLSWSHHAFVVANAVPALRQRYPIVPSNDDGGFSVAATRWRAATATNRASRQPLGSAADRLLN